MEELFQSKVRVISKINYTTPILVPSFSSKGFPQVNKLHKYLSPVLTDASLVSAYDLHYEYLFEEQIYESDILFLDSGGYEMRKDHDISDIYDIPHSSKVWDQELYEQVIQQLQPLTDIVLVNFDKSSSSFGKQVINANNTFLKFPYMVSDFLIKPSSSNQTVINMNEIIQDMLLMKPFDVIGFTEKELGSSILERAYNIYKFRKHMTEFGLSNPIHIFGCLDPLTITLYFLCGADIFDGLSWLRFAYKNGVPVYINHRVLCGHFWELDEIEAKVLIYKENLEELTNLRRKLLLFLDTSNITDLGFTESDLVQLLNIIKYIAKRGN